MSSQDDQRFSLIVCVLLVLLILFIQPTPVETAVSDVGGRFYEQKQQQCSISDGGSCAASICNGRGNIDPKTGLCNCISNWRGGDCSLRYCPFGKSWSEPSQEDHKRYRPRVECSNMGICDMNTGKCKCRPGYEGRACERSMNSSPPPSRLTSSLVSCPSANNRTCSGHGRCLTMREVSLDFNGLYVSHPTPLPSSAHPGLRPPHRSITMDGMLMH
jgi:hypothetical protein